MLKKTVALLATLLLLIGLCACGSSQSFGAADLLQTNLDIIYRGSYTDEALAHCGITATEADQMYADSIDLEIEYFCKYFDINRELLSSDTEASLHDMYCKIYGKTQYTVGEATQTNDGYEVPLSISPLLLIRNFLDEDADAIMSDWQQRMDSGEIDLLTDSEREEIWAGAIINAVKERANASSADYAEPQTISVAINSDTDGYLTISDEDMEEIDRLLIEY